MELKDLLSLESPTLEQYAEMENQLFAIAKEAKNEVARLDAEDRARGADRLVGKDDGGEERAIARAEAEKRRADAENVLSEIRGKSSALEARLGREADERAWKEVRALLNLRVKDLGEIEALIQQIGVLYGKVIATGVEAQAKAPARPNHRETGFNHLPGRVPAQIGIAIMANLHAVIDSPFARMAVSTDHFANIASHQRHDGLAGFLAPLHNAILLDQ